MLGPIQALIPNMLLTVSKCSSTCMFVSNLRTNSKSDFKIQPIKNHVLLRWLRFSCRMCTTSCCADCDLAVVCGQRRCVICRSPRFVSILIARVRDTTIRICSFCPLFSVPLQKHVFVALRKYVSLTLLMKCALCLPFSVPLWTLKICFLPLVLSCLISEWRASLLLADRVGAVVSAARSH